MSHPTRAGRVRPLTDAQLQRIRAHMEALRLDALAFMCAGDVEEDDVTYAAYASAHDDLTALLGEVYRLRDELARRAQYTRRAKRF